MEWLVDFPVNFMSASDDLSDKQAMNLNFLYRYQLLTQEFLTHNTDSLITRQLQLSAFVNKDSVDVVKLKLLDAKLKDGALSLENILPRLIVNNVFDWKFVEEVNRPHEQLRHLRSKI